MTIFSGNEKSNSAIAFDAPSTTGLDSLSASRRGSTFDRTSRTGSIMDSAIGGLPPEPNSFGITIAVVNVEDFILTPPP